MSSLLCRLQEGNSVGLSREELQPIVELGKRTTTVTTCPKLLRVQFQSLSVDQAKEVSKLALKLQVHTCLPSCEKRIPAEGQNCSMFFPKMPTLVALVGTTPRLGCEEERRRLDIIEEFHIRVQNQIRREADDANGLLSTEMDQSIALCSLLRKVVAPPLSNDDGGFFFAGTTVTGGEETTALREELKTAGVQDPNDLDLLVCYHSTLLTRRHNKYFPVRTVKEAYIVSYNPWVLLASKVNGECEIITHTPSSVFRYITKGTDSSSVLKFARELENRRHHKREEDMARQLEQGVKRGARVVSLGEAYRLLDPRMAVCSTNGSKVTYVSCHRTSKPSSTKVLMSSSQAIVLMYLGRYILNADV